MTTKIENSLKRQNIMSDYYSCKKLISLFAVCLFLATFCLCSCHREKIDSSFIPPPPDESTPLRECKIPSNLVIGTNDNIIWGFINPDLDSPVDFCWTYDLLYKIKKNIKWNVKNQKPDYFGMVKIPAGEAIVGCGRHFETSSPEAALEMIPDSDIIDEINGTPTNCLPTAKMNIPEFYIDINVVTYSQYNQCVDDKMCFPLLPNDHIPNYKSDNVPALVAYKQAERYCLWKGKRLPTEYEWEKAARGTDGRRYPWGDAAPEPRFANMCGKGCLFDWADQSWDDGYIYISPVGTYPKGKSPYGLNDATGNVKEWVTAATRQPHEHFIARGASWYSTKMELLTFYRQLWKPNTRIDDKGVRCVADPVR